MVMAINRRMVLRALHDTITHLLDLAVCHGVHSLVASPSAEVGFSRYGLGRLPCTPPTQYHPHLKGSYHRVFLASTHGSGACAEFCVIWTCSRRAWLFVLL